MTQRNIPGPRSTALVERENQYMAPGLQSVALFSGIAAARGEGCKVIDEDGNAYLDFIAGVGVGSVGHSHPRYTAALKDQVDKITFGSFTTEARTRFLELLATVTPEDLDRVQLFSGGAEAVEAALRLAKSVTGKFEFIGFWGGFHGKTGGVLGMLGDTFKHRQGPFMPGQYLTPYPNPYRTPLNADEESCGAACAEHLRDVIRYETQGEIAAILIEPIQGTAGNVIPPPGFLAAVQAVAKEHDALLIADEMITGFGRTGTMWGCDHDGVVPDIMTVGKGIGGGFPVSGLVSSYPLTQAMPFAEPSGSSSSYGGNPLASAAALAALEIILEEDLVENANKVGRVMLARLEEMKQKYPFIGDVRGKGLLLGVDLVKDRKTKEPVSKEVTRALFHEALARGLLSMCYNPTIRINPPLTITEHEALSGLDILDAALGKVGEEAQLV
ncbi:MAG: aspartate aminotransferase family protein [Alphaproteobacteria bacterium]|nr:aspartate aminotransferase family protein [Alphaproteobacteria bacterium]